MIDEIIALEAERAQQHEIDSRPRDMRALLFDRQLELWDDPARIRVANCGRRAGKTDFLSKWLLDGAANNEGVACGYVTITARNARLIIWPTLRKLARTYYPEAKINESMMTIEFPSGSTVILGGCDNTSEIEKWRGFGWFRVAVDECGSFPPYLKSLWEDALEPATIDHGGQIIFAGTLPAKWEGLWFDMVGPAPRYPFPVHRWTMWDNPHLGDVETKAQQIREDHGWDENSPTWLREYKNICVQDLGALVYPWTAERNQFKSLPPPWWKDGRPVGEGWRFVLGIDVGAVSATSFVVWGAHVHLPNDYIFSSAKRPEMLIDQIAAEIRKHKERYPGIVVVMDTGGMGRTHALELSARFGLAIHPADKRDRESAIRVLRDRIRVGFVQMLEGECNDALRSEWAVLQWNDDQTDHDDTQEDHAADGALYGHRALRKYLYEPYQPEPEIGSPEWRKREAKRMKDAAIQRVRRDQKRSEVWGE